MEKILLTGQKVILRPVEDRDYLEIWQNLQDKTIALYTGIPFPYSQMDASEYIQNSKKVWKKGKSRNFAIIEKASGKLAGLIALQFKRKDGPIGELGYWLGPNFRSKGLMGEAARLICRYGFDQEKLERIFGRVYYPNRASARVFERLGFTFEGCLRKQAYRMGQVFDINMYGILKNEFKWQP
jgi:RimJ/RimL family protein N-acetyltransferase